MANLHPAMDQFERPDPVLTNKIVTQLKSQGIFDQFRRECMADVDTKPAYQNLRQRVEGSVAAFLKKNPWRPDMNKNQLRDNLRKHIQSGGFLDIGVDRIVDQVVNPKIYTVFLPKVEEVVQNCLGMENDKPKLEPSPSIEVKSDPPKFQDKHNLAPRAKLTAPLMGPSLPGIEPLKPLEHMDGKESPGGGKLADNGFPDTDETTDKNYVVDDDDPEEKEDEDDEESPPFEPHSESDRLILGVRTDSSDNSNDSQVVTTIVDDNLEERIDNTTVKEESDKKEDDSSSDEYVPKTPTINMEGSDGTVLEFNSISEYKQYQTKFDEDSLGNVEEVVSSQWVNENSNLVKEERNSNEEDSISCSRKRKFNIESYDEGSNSSTDKESTGDEIKLATFDSFTQKKFKLDEYDHEIETSELSMTYAENEDSYTEKSLDMSDSKIRTPDNEQREKHKSSSSGSKDSGKSYHHHSHHKDNKESSTHLRSKEKVTDKENRESSTNSHSSKDRKESHRKSEKREVSRERHKGRERKKSETSSKHGEKDSKTRYHDKDTEKNGNKKWSHSSESSKKEKDDAEKNKKESRHEHREHNENKSRDHHDKEKKKYDSHDKQSDGKRDHSSSHRHDKDRKDRSKHSHCSSKHSNRNSSEKHKSDKDHKHKESSDRSRSHDKKSDKDSKEDSKKKNREHCKTYNKDENRRSSDRDSSGPSSRSHISSSSKSTSSRSHGESKVELGDRTTSNSDNTVSDNIEVYDNHNSKFEYISEQGIASPDPEPVEDSWYESNQMESDCNSSKEDAEDLNYEAGKHSAHSINEMEDENKIKYNDSENVIKDTVEFLVSDAQLVSPESNYIHVKINNFTEKATSVNADKDMEQDSTTPASSLNDSSSEKENVEQEAIQQSKDEFDSKANDPLLDEDSKVVKFKKPKIAANIFEVKKIMQERRHLKRMEKKRMKLLIKNSSGDYESDEKSPNEDQVTDKEEEEEDFVGFEDGSSDKTVKFSCLINRLTSETTLLQNSINYEQITSNLVTSWIEINPELDDYIENTLKGKVHRKYCVRLPPICDQYYKYDPELNVYFLLDFPDDASDEKELLVDSNLNNLNPALRYEETCNESQHEQQENKNSYNENNSKRRKPSDVAVPCLTNEVTVESGNNSKLRSPKRKISNKQPQTNNGKIIVSEENVSNKVSARGVDKDVNNKSNISNSNDVIASPKFMFSLTFNQTYDEVLKEKAQNSVVPSKKEAEESHKTARTVIKITNNKTSEQVVMKKVQSNLPDKIQVPRITRSESIVNGKIAGTAQTTKQIPLISRITKTKNVSTSPTLKHKSQRTNGIMASDSTSNFKEEISVDVSQKTINDVIGIQDLTPDQGNISDQDSQSGEDSAEQKHRRVTGCRQQRYDSSDLYKPRLQLSSRRVRGAGSSPETATPTPILGTGRKRTATAHFTPTVAKRRR